MKTTLATPTGCPRCDALVFAGWSGGRLVAVDNKTIPVSHAKVLVQYFPDAVFAVAAPLAGGYYLSEFHPGYDHKYAAVIHRCGNRRVW